MIIVTGAAGFIGSCLVSQLNQKGIDNLIIVDDFSFPEKNRNLKDKNYVREIERKVFVEWFRKNAKEVEFIFHIGARTDTTEFDREIFDRLNLKYSKALWEICTENEIPMVYASSAATYGLGEFGYKDDHKLVEKLKPLNPYGESKNDFDKWVLKQGKQPPFWAALKFFNVYGPNEYHKGRMASVVFHAFRQISSTRKMKLFQSHHPGYEDGKQERDFVYVKDVVNVCFWLMNHQPESGIYNVGSGKARTFLDLATNTFHSLDTDVDIEFIPTPEDIRDKYQYFTEADMSKLKNAGYHFTFTTLEEGVRDYVGNYLMEKNYY